MQWNKGDYAGSAPNSMTEGGLPSESTPHLKTETDALTSDGLPQPACAVPTGPDRPQLEAPGKEGTDDRGLAEFRVPKKRQLGEEVCTIRRLVWVGENYRDFTYQSRPS